jgi:hypothetical protein
MSSLSDRALLDRQVLLAPISNRKISRSDTLLLVTPKITATGKATFIICISGVRPYSSLRGADMSGPIASPTTNMVTENSVYIEDWASRLVYFVNRLRCVMRSVADQSHGFITETKYYPGDPTTVPVHASTPGRLMISNIGRQSTRAWGSQAAPKAT